MANNIQAMNADGVDELFVIGTALKNAKATFEENEGIGNGFEDPKLDEAIKIIELILDDGFNF